MFLRAEYILRDLALPEGESLEFTQDSPHPTRLVIRRPPKEENSGLTPDQCLGILNTEESVTDKVRPQFEILDPPHPAVKDICTRVTVHLKDLLVRGACILRWRRGLTGHSNPIATIKQPLQWSDDGQNWQMVPGAFRLIVDMGVPHKRMSEDIRSSVIEMVRTEEREPVGHELFQEAWSQRTHIPRSSLLIGMTAAEVGVKSFIGDLVPQAEWLALHAPTPPLVQMLTEYLPHLPVRQHIDGTFPFVPMGILEALRKGVNLRNKTAHAGESVKFDTLKEILLAVRDLLYLLDFYAGHAWALEVISHEMLEAIKEEVPSQQQKAKKQRQSTPCPAPLTDSS
jgi:hypothetical protein